MPEGKLTYQQLINAEGERCGVVIYFNFIPDPKTSMLVAILVTLGSACSFGLLITQAFLGFFGSYYEVQVK